MEDIKEKTADEIFEELGYEKIKELKRKNGEIWGIEYIHNREDFSITFDLIGKEVCISNDDGDAMYSTMQELQAINKKCKELGWI